MERSSHLPELNALATQLRRYRLLVNSLVPLLVVALAVLVFRWVFPYFFFVLAWLWTTEALVLLGLALAWAFGSWAFASGKIKSPACDASFATKFHLWVPRACQACGFDITTCRTAGTADHP
jgi:hypothetical protein